MESLDVIISKKRAEDLKCDMLVLFAGQDKKEKLIYDGAVKTLNLELPDLDEFSGKVEQTILLYPPYCDNKKYSIKRILIVGLGKITGTEDDVVLFERYRAAGGQIAQVCRKSKVNNLGLLLPKIKNVDESHISEHVVEGLQLGLYTFNNYKNDDENDSYPGLSEVLILASRNANKVRKAVVRGNSSAGAACVARDMANEPGNGWTPEHFAKFGRKLAKIKNVKCKVLEKTDMKKLGMGGILAVNKGSHELPKLVVLEYSPEKFGDTVMIIGKGLTFDSGGVSLKPAKGMMEMKYDMCGGAAVISAMEAIAREQLRVRVICLVPSTDNMSGGGATKPGDIISHYGGVTSEIENTDAEGRLILADALAYGLEKYNPDCVVDLATLTGAVIIALGHHHTGIMSNSDVLVEHLTHAGSLVGEPLWRLPLGESYAKQIKSEVADMKNTGGRPAGSITAAEYLHKFVGETPWAHLDIAGTAWDFTEKSYIPKGPSGIGTRTLIEFIRSCQKNGLKNKLL